jgi:prepilin-type processing-associated H-X9-DG protein
MPKVYAYSGQYSAKLLPKHTYFQVFVGKGTPFESREGLRVPDDFPDGSSKTILIVEGEPPVPWTKPADLLYDPNQSLPKFWTLRAGGFYNAAFADGSVSFLDGNKPERTRARITRNGGEKIPPDED